MELASTELIPRILSLMTEEAQRATRPRPDLSASRRRGIGPRRRLRCKCGQCKHCIDDARWERIFAEKFEDPYYYTSHLVRFSSTLE